MTYKVAGPTAKIEIHSLAGMYDARSPTTAAATAGRSGDFVKQVKVNELLVKQGRRHWGEHAVFKVDVI